MNSAPDQAGEWTRSRWLLIVLGVMGLQVGLIFALGERTPPRPRSIGAIQSLQLSAARTEFQELLDPTLFSRPHARDFSARHWLEAAVPDFPIFRWNEPTRPLELPVNQLGVVLHAFMQTNLFAAFSLDTRPVPEILTRQREEISEALPVQSHLTIHGDLAGRKLLNPPSLPAWPAEDLLTNSVVQVHVDAAGLVLSAVLLGTERVSGGSGSADADRAGLDVSRQLRFLPLDNPGWLASPVAKITSGRLIYQWRTVPATNPPAMLPKAP